MLSNLRPIEMLPARERVASALRKAIMSQEFRKGDELSIDKVASMLGISATPVREAYQMLSQEGLIKLRPNKGAIVIGMNEKWVRDHFGVRAVLEAEAARLCALNADDISSIELIVTKSGNLIENGDYSSYADLNQAFHLAIWNLCGNDKLRVMVSNLWNGLSLGARVTVEDYARISITEHIEIFHRIEAKDGEGAYKLMHRHIDRSMESMLTHLSENS